MGLMFKGGKIWALFAGGLWIVASGCAVGDEVITPEEQFVIDVANVDQGQLAFDTQIIDAYLADSGIVVIVDPSGLRYVIHDQGTGISPELVDLVAVGYQGRLLEGGVVFDENSAIGFVLNNLLLGWKVGLRKLSAGGSITMYIPSGLAYGGEAVGIIPANANLIFDVDLLNVTRAP